MSIMVAENEEKEPNFEYEVRDGNLNLYSRRPATSMSFYPPEELKKGAKDVLHFIIQVQVSDGIEKSISDAVKKYFDAVEYVGFKPEHTFIAKDIHSETRVSVVYTLPEKE